MSDRIAFCIPTYNFAEFLPATLDSIISQADDNIEIVLVDGGSTDATDEVVQLYQRQFPRITYFKRAKNCGVDRDIAKTIELAKSDYCWLFSADDILMPNAIKTMHTLTQTGDWNVLVTNFLICDSKLKPVARHEIFSSNKDLLFDWSDPDQRQEHFQKAITSTAFGSYISSVVVDRAEWLRADCCEAFYGSCWIIAAKIMSMAKNQLSLYYHDEELLLKRGDNDSFISRGIPWRVRLQLQGFPRIAESIFGEASPEHQAFKKVARNDISFASLLGFKAQLTDNPQAREELYEIVREYWVCKPFDNFFYVIIRCLNTSFLGWLKKRVKSSPSLYPWIKKIGRKK